MLGNVYVKACFPVKGVIGSQQELINASQKH